MAEEGQEHKKDESAVDVRLEVEKVPEQDKEEEMVDGNKESQRNKKRKTFDLSVTI